MTNQEKFDFIDDILMRLEDYTHGQEGKDITMSRKYLMQLEQLTKPDKIKVGAFTIHKVKDTAHNNGDNIIFLVNDKGEATDIDLMEVFNEKM